MEDSGEAHILIKCFTTSAHIARQGRAGKHAPVPCGMAIHTYSNMVGEVLSTLYPLRRSFNGYFGCRSGIRQSKLQVSDAACCDRNDGNQYNTSDLKRLFHRCSICTYLGNRNVE